MKEKKLTEIVELSETKVELDLITFCTKTNNFEPYNNFFSIVDMYKQSGLGVRFYYDNKKQSYFCKPFVKKVGFIQYNN